MQKFLFFAASLVLIGTCSSAEAACPVPNTLTNGQPADATQVMANINAIAACADAHAPAGSQNSVQTSGPGGAFGSVGPLTDGQIIVGATGASPQATTITPGAGISISNGPGSLTISASGGGGSGSDIVMALGAAWAKEMVVNGAAITSGISRSAKADLGAYVGMRMIANTNTGFATRVVSSVSYTIPAGAVAFVVHGQFHNAMVTDPGFYGARLYNVTQNRVAGSATNDSNKGVPSQPPGTANWWIQYSGVLTTQAGGNPSDVNAYYPLAGVAGDVLQLEEWTDGGNTFRIQDFSVFLVVVNAVTGEPIS